MKKIPLSEWAKMRYDPTPSAWVLRKWVRTGQISPMPEYVEGIGYMVSPEAFRVTGQRVSLLDRLTA